jgi:hypothetical protein
MAETLLPEVAGVPGHERSENAARDLAAALK